MTGDTMGVIARTPEQARRKLAEMIGDVPPGKEPAPWFFVRADRVMEEADLVPAATLRGAVEALVEIERELEEQRYRWGLGPWATRLLEIARQVVPATNAGGRS